MNLTKLFETQLKLDAEIEKKHPTAPGEDRLAKRILALQVELGECANEWRGFKFWSANQKPKERIYTTEGASSENAAYYRCGECESEFSKEDVRLDTLFGKNDEECPKCEEGNLYAFRHKNPLLEEYVDCLHFILSIGLDTGLSNRKLLLKPFREKTVELQFIETMDYIMQFHYSPNKGEYQDLLSAFIALGKMLDFTWEQREMAYMKKNQINHERQTEGY